MSAFNSPAISEMSTISARTRKRIIAPFYSLTRAKVPRVKFGVPLADALKDDTLPSPLVDMIVYIAQHGVTTTDLFRRNGNPTDLRFIIKRLTEGKEVVYNNYNFYTLASVVKKFLLKIPDGVFGSEREVELLEVLTLENRMRQYDAIHSIISSLPEATQMLLALLFGTWFRIVNHSEYNTMNSEAVAKSVAPSLFHTCADSPQKVERAVKVLQILIDDFAVTNMFGRKNIQYFADTTRTGINVREKYRYEFRYPVGDDSAPLDDYLQLFSRLLQSEAQLRGFDPITDAITEEEFYGSPMVGPRGRSDTKISGGSSTVEVRLPASSSPPSPQSLQQASTAQGSDPDYNPHKKLTHVSSLSAPEVNQGCSVSTPDSTLAASKRMYLSTSLSRFDHVRRRQMLRLKKRSNWFLSPNASTSADSESILGGSREASMGKSSMEGTSSDALASDVTASDGGLSGHSGDHGLRLSSDIDCSYEDSGGGGSSPATLGGTPCLTPIRAHQPLQRLAHMHHHRHQQDVLNANHGGTTTSTPKRSPPLLVTTNGANHGQATEAGTMTTMGQVDNNGGVMLIEGSSPRIPLEHHTSSPGGQGDNVVVIATTPHLQQQQQQQQQQSMSMSSSHMPSTQSDDVVTVTTATVAASTVAPDGSDSQVRFFMVESYYGSPTSTPDTVVPTQNGGGGS